MGRHSAAAGWIRRLSSGAAILALAMFPRNALASGSATGVVNGLLVEGNGTSAQVALAYVSNYTGGPACATTHAFTIDLTTNQGRAEFSVLLTARQTGATVQVAGQGTCNLWSNSEDVSYIYQ
jgi:hypothetical protein